MDASNKIKSLMDMATTLNAWDIISIMQGGVHCREKFFVENFEPESIQDTGKYVTATAHVGGVAFYALFDIGRGDLEDAYKKVVEKIKGVAA